MDLTALNLDYTASNDTSGRNFFVRYGHSATSNNFGGPNLMGAQHGGGLSTGVSGAGAAGILAAAGAVVALGRRRRGCQATRRRRRA
ncbi:hypothetical protein OVA24_17380 [Luteolibacter sp. SL250]|uniref:hypothetical protein n=1 Tax=Luteolibacter sp. SL250 TaxID=2995170 RepID=UPI002270DE3D|nr:hypothetical protein [Luteolibacter sp. SL250]WAC19004.1 hypothetical protein OVA24_17380 [Luteolibacter sp. SL250]